MSREQVAVIGAGVSGLTAAYVLQRVFDVVLFDSAEQAGGHAHTHELTSRDGRAVPLDSGFLVHNERTYPYLRRLFRELDVATRPSEMSMSVQCEECGLQYAGGKGLNGLLARRRGGPLPRRANLEYLQLLAQVPRFHRQARRLLSTPRERGDPDFGEFLRSGRYTRYFVDHFAVPLVSAVWSASGVDSCRYPARSLFTFLHNHGMLSIGGSPTWRTVVGGSREYVDRVTAGLAVVRTATPVRAVQRTNEGVAIRDDSDRVHEVARAVIATHADDALALLPEATPHERDVLGSFRYTSNTTWLHTDSNLLPPMQRTRASWNYLKPTCRSDTDRTLVSYHLNRLMCLAEPEDYVVTLNATDRIAPRRVRRRMTYRHPVYTRESVAAQEKLPGLGDHRLQFAGAHHGWGFHEDGCRSGVRAARQLGVRWGQ